MSPLTTTAFSSWFGAQVHGYDPQVDPDLDTSVALRDLLDVHKLLLFRGIPFEPAQHVALMRAFGPVIDEYKTGRAWLTLSNVDPDSTIFHNRRLPFHQDYVFTPWPYPALSLFASEVVGGVARTEFASNIGGFLGLNSADRQRFSDLTVVHATAKSRENDESTRTRIMADADPDGYYQTTWPLINKHPRTAEPLLYVSQLFASHVVGMAADESEAVIEQSFDALYRPDNLYTHEWELYDLLVWDNVALQHARGPIEPPSRRTLRRVVVSERERDDMLAASNGTAGDLAALS